MWRQARPEDGEEIVSMCLALDREDPGFAPVEAGQVRETLAVFEREPGRGRAVVAEVGGRVAGYAFLVRGWLELAGFAPTRSFRSPLAPLHLLIHASRRA